MTGKALQLGASHRKLGALGVKLSILLVFFALLIFSIGCQSAKPAAATVEARTAEDEPWKPLLTDNDQRRVIAAMNSARSEDVAPAAISTGPPRGRWSDVFDAVRLAAVDVEMAILTAREEQSVWEFTLRTIEESPVALQITRTNDSNVWTATATVGLFHDEPARAEQLLSAFEGKMKELSRKRKFE